MQGNAVAWRRSCRMHSSPDTRWVLWCTQTRAEEWEKQRDGANAEMESLKLTIVSLKAKLETQRTTFEQERATQRKEMSRQARHLSSELREARDTMGAAQAQLQVRTPSMTPLPPRALRSPVVHTTSPRRRVSVQQANVKAASTASEAWRTEKAFRDAATAKADAAVAELKEARARWREQKAALQTQLRDAVATVRGAEAKWTKAAKEREAQRQRELARVKAVNDAAAVGAARQARLAADANAVRPGGRVGLLCCCFCGYCCQESV